MMYLKFLMNVLDIKILHISTEMLPVAYLDTQEHTHTQRMVLKRYVSLSCGVEHILILIQLNKLKKHLLLPKWLMNFKNCSFFEDIIMACH